MFFFNRDGVYAVVFLTNTLGSDIFIYFQPLIMLHLSLIETPFLLNIYFYFGVTRNGIYPLTAFAMMQPPPSRPRAITPELAESVKSETPEPCDVETRMVTTIQCGFRPPADDGKSMLYILLRMDDKMNRFLQTEWTDDLTAALMAEELVHLGFINEVGSV